MSDEIMDDEVTEAEAETPETQEQKTFTQEELDRIVSDRIARTKRQYDKRLDGLDLDQARAALQREADAEVEKQKERGEWEEILKTTAQKKDQRIAELEKRLESREIDGALLAAAGRYNAGSAEQVVQLIRNMGRLSQDGAAEVVDPNGTPRYNDSGDAMSVDELVSDFLSANPHFVKASSGGAGSQAAVGGSTSKPMSAVDMAANWKEGGREAYRAQKLAKK